MESLSTVIIGSLFLQERSSIWTYFTLFPICGGVALSCNNTTSFSMIGFLIVVLSNLSFSTRSVMTRLIQQNYPDSIEQINFFADISLYGFYVLVPLTFMLEGQDIFDAFVVGGVAEYGATAVGVDAQMHTTGSNEILSAAQPAVQRFLRMVTESLVTTVSSSVTVNDASSAEAAVEGSKVLTDASALTAFSPLTAIVLMLLFNGIMFAAYNLMSYLLLQRTDLITHAVINVSRRVFTIFFTALYFKVEINAANVLGVTIAVCGVVAFGYCKSKEGKLPAKVISLQSL